MKIFSKVFIFLHAFPGQASNLNPTVQSPILTDTPSQSLINYNPESALEIIFYSIVNSISIDLFSSNFEKFTFNTSSYKPKIWLNFIEQIVADSSITFLFENIENGRGSPQDLEKYISYIKIIRNILIFSDILVTKKTYWDISKVGVDSYFDLLKHSAYDLNSTLFLQTEPVKFIGSKDQELLDLYVSPKYSKCKAYVSNLIELIEKSRESYAIKFQGKLINFTQLKIKNKAHNESYLQLAGSIFTLLPENGSVHLCEAYENGHKFSNEIFDLLIKKVSSITLHNKDQLKNDSLVEAERAIDEIIDTEFGNEIDLKSSAMAMGNSLISFISSDKKINVKSRKQFYLKLSGMGSKSIFKHLMDFNVEYAPLVEFLASIIVFNNSLWKFSEHYKLSPSFELIDSVYLDSNLNGILNYVKIDYSTEFSYANLIKKTETVSAIARMSHSAIKRILKSNSETGKQYKDYIFMYSQHIEDNIENPERVIASGLFKNENVWNFIKEFKNSECESHVAFPIHSVPVILTSIKESSGEVAQKAFYFSIFENAKKSALITMGICHAYETFFKAKLTLIEYFNLDFKAMKSEPDLLQYFFKFFINANMRFKDQLNSQNENQAVYNRTITSQLHSDHDYFQNTSESAMRIEESDYQLYLDEYYQENWPIGHSDCQEIVFTSQIYYENFAGLSKNQKSNLSINKVLETHFSSDSSRLRNIIPLSLIDIVSMQGLIFDNCTLQDSFYIIDFKQEIMKSSDYKAKNACFNESIDYLGSVVAGIAKLLFIINESDPTKLKTRENFYEIICEVFKEGQIKSLRLNRNHLVSLVCPMPQFRNENVSYDFMCEYVADNLNNSIRICDLPESLYLTGEDVKNIEREISMLFISFYPTFSKLDKTFKFRFNPEIKKDSYEISFDSFLSR